MHDFLLAKQIIDELRRILEEKGLDGLKKVRLEVGNVSMAHDGHAEHAEEIDIENLKFGLEGIAANTPLKGVEFMIEKVPGDEWRITDIEV